MPFQSEKQRRYLWANEPKIARDWADTYGSRIKKDDGGIARIGFFTGMREQEQREKSQASHDRGGQRHQAAAARAQAQASHDRGGQRHRAAAAHAQAQASHDRGGQQHQQKANFKILPGTGEKDTKDVVKASKRIDDRKFTQGEKFKQRALNRNKVLSMRNLGLMPKGMSGLWGNLISGMTGKVPAWAEDLTEEELMQIATSGPYLSQQKTKGDASRLGRGRDLLGRVTEGEGLLNRGELNASEWERLFPTKNMNQAGGGGGDGQRGGYMGYPSYEAWKAAQGTGDTAAVPPELSAFQQSLTTGANNPFDYYVGKDPSAKNLAWGKQMGVDPRTMGLTSFAADGGRIPAAFGGIMDSSTGRRAYGFGSFFKKIGRAAKKVLKSPIAKGALLGLGGYYLGGGQGLGGSGMFGTKFGKNFALKNLMNRKGAGFLMGGGKDNMYEGKWNPWKIGIGAAAALPFFMGGKEEDEDDKFDYEGAKNKYRDEMMRIKAGAMAGTLDPNQFNYLGVKDGGRIGYYAGGQSTPSDYTMEDAMMTTTQDKLGGITDVMKQADLNRQGSVGQFYAANGGSADAKLLARVQELQDEGLDYNSAMAQALKELSSGKAQGGRIGYAGGSGRPPVTMGQAPQMPAQPPQAPQRPNPMPAPQPNRMGGMPGGMNPMMGGMHPMMNRPMMGGMPRGMPRGMPARRRAQEGGLMDLGGMEKDYRNDGGFVPLGGEEKADDVPARLSKNEFVFTADAVRGAGDGDIDKGAEIMENIMKNLEQGGQISEETQGLSGAQEMFGVSERLSEVV